VDELTRMMNTFVLILPDVLEERMVNLQPSSVELNTS
jgi:hypothetical protein